MLSSQYPVSREGRGRGGARVGTAGTLVGRPFPDRGAGRPPTARPEQPAEPHRRRRRRPAGRYRPPERGRRAGPCRPDRPYQPQERLRGLPRPSAFGAERSEQGFGTRLRLAVRPWLAWQTVRRHPAGSGAAFFAVLHGHPHRHRHQSQIRTGRRHRARLRLARSLGLDRSSVARGRHPRLRPGAARHVRTPLHKR